MNFLGKLSRIVVALLLGLLIVVILIQQDSPVKAYIEHTIDTIFSATFKCQFHAQVKSIHILSGELELEDLAATGIDDEDWSWRAKRALVTISWADVIKHHIFYLNIGVYNLILDSALHKNSLAIGNHIKLLTTPPDIDIPFIVKSCKIYNGKVTIFDQDNGVTTSFGIKNDAHTLHGVFKSSATLSDGCIVVNNTTIIDNLSAVITAEKSFIECTANFTIPSLDAENQRCNLRGMWKNNSGIVTLKSAHELLTGRVQVDQAHQLQAEVQFAGLCSATLTADVHDFANTVHIKAQATAAGYNGFVVPTIDVTLQHNNSVLYGDLHLSTSDTLNASGEWKFDMERASATADLASAGQEFVGKFYGDCENCSLTGSSGNKKVELIVGNKPTIYLKSLQYWEDELLLIQARGEPNGTFKGSIDYPIIRNLLHDNALDMPGEGTIKLEGLLKKEGIQAHYSMHDAHIRLPYTYNLLQGLAGDVMLDFAAKKISIKNAAITLHTGEIVSPQTNCMFDENFKLSYAHVPLIMRNCFMSWEKDIFALISASLITTYAQQSVPRITGHIILDRSHVSSNLFSAEFGKGLFGLAVSPLSGYHNDLEVDLSLATRAPLQVKTPFLEASARLNFNLKGTVHQPELSGSIEIVNGSLEFPYQPLFITSGKIDFMPHQLDDPMIDLRAKNTIKKYTIGMSVTGSVRNPKITFESSPTLEEAQIITLLLGGSEDGSLYLAMPTTIMDSIENLIFGPAVTSSKMQKYLKNLFRPFKNIRIVPSFSDQTGRGGLRGSVAIEVNDRLSGLIEQNFSLTEDTRFEVDYALSDDTSVRALKDERGDVGAELEMRWKF